MFPVALPGGCARRWSRWWRVLDCVSQWVSGRVSALLALRRYVQLGRVRDHVVARLRAGVMVEWCGSAAREAVIEVCGC